MRHKYHQKEFSDTERKKIIRLHDVDGLTFRIIATRFGVSPAMVADHYRQVKEMKDETGATA